MIFQTISDAQKFYNAYAKRVGFGMTITDGRRKNDVFIYKRFSCHRCGQSRRGKETISHRDSSKIGCTASVRVRYDKDTNTYIMYDVILEHNHILHPTAAMYLRSHRKICTPEKAEILNMRSVEAYLKTCSPFEKQAAAIYTRSIFHKFQQELIEVAACHPQRICEDESKLTLRVKSFERVKLKGICMEMQKEYTEKEVECSCKSFEFKGFLCRHALLALQYVGIDSIPNKYFLQRWCKDMRYRHACQSFDVQKEEKKCSSSRYTNLIFRFMKVAEAASCSEEAYDIAVAEISKILGRVMESMNGLSI
ncbi:hypothetical protein Taro_006600 [Colocasia esculenta]|uniref:Protein FAR1-RELATED SEQUENCE n=1 Tax=Colocasia esculenta TaxID=4460 RepID=A0A843TP54_COLES|nr:hypothetical protein [Colocasia esculenta]